MIHKVTLPEQTLRKLTEVVELQFVALGHASSAGKLDAVDLGTALNTTTAFAGRGEQIVAALKRGRKPTECSQRWQLLNNFATQTQGAEYLPNPSSKTLREVKVDVVQRMRRDALALACEGEPTACLEFYMPDVETGEWLPKGLVAISEFYESQRKAGVRGKARYPDWLNATRDFLIAFYEGLDEGLQRRLLRRWDEVRSAALLRFVRGSESQEPGVARFAMSTTSRRSARQRHFSEIEHYLPKSVYPHLSCHPYNLIPMCGPCNRIHSDKDPLQSGSKGDRRPLESIFLPYRGKAVGAGATLSIKYSDDDPARPELGIVQTIPHDDLKSKIQALGEVYEIPQRWAERSDEIGDRLWRRIRQFLHDDMLSSDELDIQFLQHKLGRLLAYMQEDFGKDPLAFPLLWWLAFLLSDELDPVADGTLAKDQSALVAELQSWVRTNQARLAELTSRTDEIKTVVRTMREVPLGRKPSDT